MLKKVNRLAKAKDIQKTFARGRTFFNHFFNIKFLPASLENKAFTVVVSTKVFKNATDRNRLKRIIREYIRKNLKTLPFGSYIIMAKPKIAQQKEQFRVASFLEVLGKIK